MCKDSTPGQSCSFTRQKGGQGGKGRECQGRENELGPREGTAPG